MNNKRVIQRIAVGMMAATMFVGGNMGAVYAGVVEPEAVVTESTDAQNGSRKAQTVWMYKEVDGKRYVRLYDATNEKWLTDWILCD